MGRYIIHTAIPKPTPISELEDTEVVGVPWRMGWTYRSRKELERRAEKRDMMKRMGYTVSEVCEGLGVSMGFMRRAIKDGLVKVVWLGRRCRIPLDEYERIYREGIAKKEK